jgi:hypothetical protein
MFPEGFHAVMASGPIRFISRKIDEKSIRALITPAGGEKIDWTRIPGKRIYTNPDEDPEAKGKKEPEARGKQPAGGSKGGAEAERKSAANLRQLAFAMFKGADSSTDQSLPGTLHGKGGKPLLSWRVALLPYLDGGDKLYRQFKLDEPWDSEHNKKLLPKMPAVFAPVAGAAKEKHVTHYQVLVGGGAAFQDGRKTRFPASFLDGTSNTVLIVEAAEAVPWTRPADLRYDPKKPLPKFGQHFKEGFHAAFADGTVRFVSRAVNEKHLRAVITAAGGEEVDLKPFKMVSVP